MTISEPDSTGKTLFLYVFGLVVLVVVASYLLIMLMGYGFVFFTSDGLALSMKSFYFPVFLFFFIGFEVPAVGGTVFQMVWIVYLLCFVAAWRWREGLHDVVRKSFSRPLRSLFSNFLLVMPLLSSMILLAVLAVVFSQQSFGIPTGQPSFPAGTSVQEIFLNLAYAPFGEELGFRIVPMGLFVVFYVFLVGKNRVGGKLRLVIESFLYPEGAKKRAGLTNVSEHGILHGISIGEWVMVFITTVIFALAHIIAGVGWEPGKVTSVLVQGFFFGVTYLAYGFEAPILLHWFFDYYLFFFDPSLLSKFFPSVDPILTLVELLIIGLGIFGWVAFAVVGLRKLLSRRKAEQTLPPPPPVTLPS